MSVAASEGYHATQKKYVYSGSSKGSGRPPRPGLDRPIIRKLLEPIRFLCLSFETNVIPHASLIIAHHRETGKNPLINPDALPFPPPPPFLFYLFNWTYRNKRRATTRNYMGNGINEEQWSEVRSWEQTELFKCTCLLSLLHVWKRTMSRIRKTVRR